MDGKLSWHDRQFLQSLASSICGDLWESPDHSAVAMTLVRPKEPGETWFLLWFEQEPEKLFEVKIPKLTATGMPYNRGFRYPQISPTKDRLYFDLPRGMATSQLFTMPIRPSGMPNFLADQTGYCVVWGGENAGKVILEQRRMGKNSVLYSKKIIPLRGKSIDIEGGGEFPPFVDRWLGKRGGRCTIITMDGFIDEVWYRQR